MAKTKPGKEDVILQAGKDLFWKHGFRRVTVEEVCQKAGVSKMTFYRFFANKTELAKAVFERESNLGIEQFRNVLHSDDAPQEKIRRLLLLKHEGASEISREFLADFYTDPDSELHAFVEAQIFSTWQAVVGDFKIAQQNGVFRPDFKPEFFLLISQKITESLSDPAMLNLFDNPQGLIMELTKLLMYGITPHR